MSEQDLQQLKEAEKELKEKIRYAEKIEWLKDVLSRKDILSLGETNAFRVSLLESGIVYVVSTQPATFEFESVEAFYKWKIENLEGDNLDLMFYQSDAHQNLYPYRRKTKDAPPIMKPENFKRRR